MYENAWDWLRQTTPSYHVELLQAMPIFIILCCVVQSRWCAKLDSPKKRERRKLSFRGRPTYDALVARIDKANFTMDWATINDTTKVVDEDGFGTATWELLTKHLTAITLEVYQSPKVLAKGQAIIFEEISWGLLAFIVALEICSPKNSKPFCLFWPICFKWKISEEQRDLDLPHIPSRFKLHIWWVRTFWCLQIIDNCSDTCCLCCRRPGDTC